MIMFAIIMKTARTFGSGREHPTIEAAPWARVAVSRRSASGTLIIVTIGLPDSRQRLHLSSTNTRQQRVNKPTRGPEVSRLRVIRKLAHRLRGGETAHRPGTSESLRKQTP